ncbi:esterase B1-like [Thrips palmi]|uniref:Carboxylic ester hydrolase n=1 Tax=Thrips palmi TaxID=161013 RepID=A0A6P8Z564_THRPL|nr:esterase B1-like [Thrips palmi]
MQAPQVAVALVALVVVSAVLGSPTPDAGDADSEARAGMWFVSTKDGTLAGTQQVGADGIRFYSFQGIPYAKPPVGPLRFKNPRPAVPWHGRVRPALSGGDKCPQLNAVTGQSEGREDCLYLNVFTPFLGAAVLPVMVYLHGGAFQTGSGDISEVGPDFLVRHDVVLVTINYRLGAFGFLNMDSDDAPGNAGLKDQRAALRWVRDNVANFGGNPNHVTIFGNSAGAASVHYHTLLNDSRGLFRAAIMQSGNALQWWAYHDTFPDRLDMARRLCDALGGDSASEEGMVRSFKQASTGDILAASARMARGGISRVSRGAPRRSAKIHLKGSLCCSVSLAPLFRPSPERRDAGRESRFLGRDAESLIRQPQVPPVPTVAGLSGNEGVYSYYYLGLDKVPELVSALLEKPEKLLPDNVSPSVDTAHILGHDFPPTLSADAAARFGARLREAYGLDAGVGNLQTLLGDINGAVAVHRLVNLTLGSHGPEAPLFLYHFLEDGDYNLFKKSANIAEAGATHTDELGYLFRITSPTDLRQTLFGGSASSKTLDALTTLWTNFAKQGDPGFQSWPAAAGDASTAAYAKISARELGTLGEGLGGDRMGMWEELYAGLRSREHCFGLPIPLPESRGCNPQQQPHFPG